MNFRSSQDDFLRVAIEVDPSELTRKTEFRMMDIIAEKAATELYEKSREMLFAHFDDARLQEIVTVALKERVLDFFRMKGL